MIDTAKKNSSSLKRAGVISLTAALVLSLGASGTAISYLHSADNAATANTVPWHGIDASDMLKIDAMAIEDAGAVLPGKVLDVDAKVQLLPDALDNAYAMVTVKVPSSSQLILEGEKEPTESLKLFDYEVCDGWELVKSQDCTTDDPDTSCILETYAYTGEMAPGDIVDFIDKVQFANISNASNLGKASFSANGGVMTMSLEKAQEVSYSKSGWLIDENGHCDVPAGVKTIPSHEFKDRTSLKSVTFQPGTTAINMGAFQGCTSLESIELPSSLIFLDSYVFQGCTSLKSIEIPEGVPTVDECAFQNCTSLSTVKIPSSIIYISSDAFIGTGLTYYSDVSGLTRDQLDMLAKNSGTVDGSQVYPYPAFPQLIDPPTPDYLPMPENYVIDYHYKAIQTTGFQSYKEAVDVMLSQLDYSKYLS